MFETNEALMQALRYEFAVEAWKYSMTQHT